MGEIQIPNQFELMPPTLSALRDLGGSGRIDEIVETVVEAEGFSEEQLAVRRSGSDHMSKIEYRLAWARNGLKLIGAIENSSRGVWALTEFGKGLTGDEAVAAVKEWRSVYNREYARKKREDQESNTPEGGSEALDAEEELLEDGSGNWREELNAALLLMSPDGFERLAQRLLREAGFRNVEVLGQSGDGGIDGVGVYRLSLVSFPVYFQCKRYRNPVGPDAVRDFRGAMSGRGEKGLLITTSSFTAAAREEATRDGAPPVDLVNGDDLADLLYEYQLGVSSKMVESVSVDSAFFASV